MKKIDLVDPPRVAGVDIAGSYYTMRAAGNAGEILLYQEIGGGGGLFSDPGISAEGFAKDLKAMGKVSTINCRINSPGGNVFEGMTIYNLLASHPAKVVCHIDGLAASIASVIAMAGDEINIADNGMMMIHNAWGVGVGTADEIRKTADVLDSVTQTIAKTYSKRSGADMAKIQNMMNAETWMSAEDAQKCGLADKIVDNMNVKACAFDAKRLGFKNVPTVLTETIEATPRRERFAARFMKIETDRIRHRLASRS